MEYCVRHETAIVVFDSGSFCPSQCPLCDAEERIAALDAAAEEMLQDAVRVALHYEKRIEALNVEVDGLRETLSDLDFRSDC